MTTIADLKQRVAAAIDDRRSKIIAVGETIMGRPELGFKEFETAALVAETFAELELDYRTGLAITGVSARIETGRPRPHARVDRRARRPDGSWPPAREPGHPRRARHVGTTRKSPASWARPRYSAIRACSAS